MTILDGKELIGIVVDWDDPLKLGRVRIGIPSIMGNKIIKDLLPWISTFSNANADGPTTFDRPPQPGTIMQVFFPHGTGGVNGIAKSVLNGLRNPQAAFGVDLSQQVTWVKDAFNFKPQVMAPPNTQQVTKTNPSGAEQVTTEIQEKGKVTSYNERIGVPSNLAAPLFIPLYSTLQNISTAIDNGAAAFQSSMVNSLPGQLLSLSSVLSSIDSSKFSTEVNNAISTINNIITEKIPLSGTNFISMGIRVGPAGISNLISSLDGAVNFADIQSRLMHGINDISTLDISSLSPVKIHVTDDISITLDPQGVVSLDISQVLQDLISAFESLLSSFSTITGQLLGNSEIPRTLQRLPAEVQAKVREKIGQTPLSLSLAFEKSNSFFGV